MWSGWEPTSSSPTRTEAMPTRRSPCPKPCWRACSEVTARVLHPRTAVAHRLLLSRARSRADSFELTERVTELAGGLLTRLAAGVAGPARGGGVAGPARAGARSRLRYAGRGRASPAHRRCSLPARRGLPDLTASARATAQLLAAPPQPRLPRLVPAPPDRLSVSRSSDRHAGHVQRSERRLTLSLGEATASVVSGDVPGMRRERA